MNVQYIPPVDAREVRIQQMQEKITNVVKDIYKGKGRQKQTDDLVAALMVVITPHLRLPSEAKGATVMTEGAALKQGGRYKKAPNNI